MRALRAWTERRPPQRLQISEVCDLARDFLEAKAIPGLGSRYLPAGLRVRVSPLDYRSLQPFHCDLRDALRAVADAIAERPSRVPCRPRLHVELAADPALHEGDPPHLVAGYPRGFRRVRWSAAADAADGAAVDELEVVFTVGAGRGTAVQEVRAVRLHGGGGDSDEDHDSGIVIPIPFASELLPGRPRSGVVELGARLSCGAGGRAVLFAEDGALVLGRDPELAHLVPRPAPAVLSGCHCALLRDPGDRIRVMDLGSTNGTWVDGRPCPPFEPVPVALPAIIDIGNRGALRMEIRPRPSPPAAGGRPSRPDSGRHP